MGTHEKAKAGGRKNYLVIKLNELLVSGSTARLSQDQLLQVIMLLSTLSMILDDYPFY